MLANRPPLARFEQEIKSEDPHADELREDLESDERVKRNYNFVTSEKREQLIEFLSSGKYTIKEAAQKFEINYSTAKYIFKKHRSQVLELEERKHPRFAMRYVDDIPLDANRIACFRQKVELLTELSARMLHHHRLPREQVISLVMEKRNILDLLLLEAGSFKTKGPSGLIESIMEAHRALDWYLVALSVSVDRPGGYLEGEQVNNELAIQSNIKALQVLVNGLVQKSFTEF